MTDKEREDHLKALKIAANKRYRAKLKERRKADPAFHEQERERWRKRFRSYYAKHADRINERTKAWRATPEGKAWASTYWPERYQRDKKKRKEGQS